MKDLILIFLFLLGIGSMATLSAAEMEDPIAISSIEQTQETCNLGNGTLTINITGSSTGMEYSIDGGTSYQSSPFFDNLQSGDYLIIVRNGPACSEVRSIQIADAPEPLVGLVAACVPGRNLSDVTPTVTGGILPYAYSWTGGMGVQSTDEILNNVPPGEYYLLVTDNLGCTIRDTILIEQCCELITDCPLQNFELACMEVLPSLDVLSLNALQAKPLQDSLKLLGITVNDDSCGAINISYQDVQENNPTTCADGPMIITRTVTITDSYLSFDCIQKIEVQSSFTPSISNNANDEIQPCKDDLPSIFQTWLNDHAGMTIEGCTGPYIYSIDPIDPVAPTQCGEETEVLFIVTDACGNEVSSMAKFSVIDEEKPDISCPSLLELNTEDPDMMIKVDAWIATVTATDNCSIMPSITDDLDPASLIVVDCSSSLDVTVNFEAQDLCGNSSNCDANIQLVGLAVSELSCGDDLTMDCDADRVEEISTWMVGFTALDEDGDPVKIDTDLDDQAVADLQCNIPLMATFSIIDDCNRVLDCSRTITILDDVKPELQCPAELEISDSDPDPMASITPWLAEAMATDNCDLNPTTTNDFTSLSDLCNVTTNPIVTFEVMDNCGNTNTCQATIVIAHELPALTCPTPLEIDCSDQMMETQVTEWLATIVATGNDGNPIDNDFSNLSDMAGCDEPQIINFTTSNACNASTSCMSSVTIIDETAPEVSCPEELEVDILDSALYDQVNVWLGLATAIDCNSYTLEDDFGFDLGSDICEDDKIVTFTAVDRCGLTATCTSMLIVSNSGTIEISCPDDVEFRCSDPQLEYKINILISEVPVIADNNYNLENDFNPLDLKTGDCIQDGLAVQVTAEDICYKEDRCSFLINFLPDPEIYIPNVITPDNDGFNDYFTAFGNESVDYISSMVIFNKWGSKIYEVNDISINEETEGWNGRYGTEDEMINVYTYHLVIIDTFGNTIDKAGTVQILK